MSPPEHPSSEEEVIGFVEVGGSHQEPDVHDLHLDSPTEEGGEQAQTQYDGFEESSLNSTEEIVNMIDEIRDFTRNLPEDSTFHRSNIPEFQELSLPPSSTEQILTSSFLQFGK